MHIFFYNAFIFLYTTGIRFASFWNRKAAQWVKGREVFPKIEPGAPCVWMHTASLGEFEQGRTVIEHIRKTYPGFRVVVTFFSPSGFEIRKNYVGADAVFYLPADSPKHARQFIEAIQPALVIWVKYDYWFHYLTTLKSKKIPVLLVSGIFREGQPFFKWYGSLWREMLTSFEHLFVQNKHSRELIEPVVGNKVSINGDTRFDRVIDIVQDFKDIERVAAFCGNFRVVVAGSTWEEDEAQLVHFVNTRPEIRFIIVPHEISDTHLTDARKKFRNSLLFSELDKYVESFPHVLIINNIGMLSRLYKYADIAYIGGGFNNSGIHNILEAAVYGIPVVFGPVYEKFEEAKALVEMQGAFSFNNAPELEKILNGLLDDEIFLEKCGIVAGEYVQANSGATKRIMDYIAENRLLTN